MAYPPKLHSLWNTFAHSFPQHHKLHSNMTTGWVPWTCCRALLLPASRVPMTFNRAMSGYCQAVMMDYCASGTCPVTSSQHLLHYQKRDFSTSSLPDLSPQSLWSPRTGQESGFGIIRRATTCPAHQRRPPRPHSLPPSTSSATAWLLLH